MKVLISCGEPSGDLYAGALTKEIRALDPSAQVYGLGGPRFREAGGQLVEDYRGLTVTGLTEALSVVPRSLALYRRLVKLVDTDRPDVFVPVDFPEINFRVAAALHRRGVPVTYYVCPQVWAWRRRRLKSMKRFVQRALVIFSFEEDLYRQSGIPVQFVGHPLLDLSTTSGDPAGFREAHGLARGAPTVALLPGSRANEVQAILPTLVLAVDQIRAQIPDCQFLVARAPYLDDAVFEPLSRVTAGDVPVAVVEARTDDVLAAADVVATASGTATVQAAIHRRPMVIVYRLSPLTYHLVRAFAHVNAIGMVNVIAEEHVVPELVQDDFTPESVSAEVVSFLRDPKRAEQTRAALDRVRTRLGSPGATRRAAEAVLEEAHAARGRGVSSSQGAR